MYVCPSVLAFSSLEAKRLDGSGRANNQSMRQSGGKTMVPVIDRSVARGTSHVRLRKPLEKVVAKGAGLTNRQILLKLGGLIATMLNLI